MKKTLMILAVAATFGTMLVGCGTSGEGNNDTNATPATGDKKGPAPSATGDKTPDAGATNAAGNTPAAGGDTKAPAGNTPAVGGDTKAPAGNAAAKK